MQDDDCDTLIDCADSDCAADPICQPARKDPTTITFGKQPGLDRFRSHATLDVGPLDIPGIWVGVLLTNPAGVLYEAVLPPGALSPRGNGTTYQFRDPAARTGEGNAAGIYTIKLKQHKDQRGYTIKAEAYADLSAATDPMMLIQFYLGGEHVFITKAAPWTPMRGGWRAPKDH